MLNVRAVAGVLALSLLVTVDTPAGAQSAGISKAVRAKNDAVILVEGTDRVKIVRRREADIRAIHDPAERWVILLVDYVDAAKKKADGGVDTNYTFYDVAEWPLGERWSGPAVVDDYLIAGEGFSQGLGLTTAKGFMQLLGPNRSLFADESAIRVTYRGSGRGGGGGQLMDVVEARKIQEARANVARRAQLPSAMRDRQSSMSMGVVVGGDEARVAGIGTPRAIATTTSSGQPAMRVGGSVRTPQKIHHVDPVRSKAAAAAGIFGMVILEVTIGTDGSVADAKVLRSIPLLDQSAIDAVKQWRYTAPQLNGQPVPVVMTVTVEFR